MKRNILYLCLGTFLFGLAGCQEEEYVYPTVESAGMTSVTAEILTDGVLKGEQFTCYPSSTTQDTYIIPIPWYYPIESLTETNESMFASAKLSAVLPSNVSLSPSLGIVDLRQENAYTLTEPLGTQRKITIKGERTKSSECSILAFEIIELGTSGIVNEDNAKVALPIPDSEDVSNVTVSLQLSYHASVASPEGAERVDTETMTLSGIDLTDEVVFTIKAHDGTTKNYTVKRELPNKILYGYGAGSEKGLFSLDITAFNHGNVPTLAVVEKHLVISVGDGTTPVYVARKTGALGGQIERGDAAYNGSITSDAAGNMLIADKANSGEVFKIYTTNAVNKVPEEFISWTNTFSASLGDRIAAQGDIHGDGIIVATGSPWPGISDGYTFVYWEIKDGVVGEPVEVSLAGTGRSWWTTVKVCPRDLKASDGFFFSYYQSGSGYFNGIAYVTVDGTQGKVASTIAEDARTYYSSNFAFDKMDAKVFNNAKYLVMTSSNHFGTWPANDLYLFDVSNANSITGSMDSSDALVYLYQIGSPNFPWNANIGDMVMAPTLDGYYMHIYLINYSYNVLMGFQIDCIQR